MKRYGWAAWGDVNAFFGLMLDNVAVMVLFVTLVTTGDVAFTPRFVLTHMIPGTALGVLLGDLVYTVMAFRLARRTHKSDVTAMPLGLDTPSTFGIPLFVILPVLHEGHDKFPGDPERAMLYAWHVGVVVLVLSGVFKVICSPLGNAVRRWVPRAGLLGSLAAIAVALIAFLPLLESIASVPLAGLAVLTVILVTLVAHRALPYKVPGALAAVILGVILVFGGRWLGDALGAVLIPGAEPTGPQTLSLPALPPFTTADWTWWRGVLVAALEKLPVALPFALATIVGGIDCTESAAAVGDEYDTRTVLLTEGLAALVAGLLGGVIQTTPYIGHPAYKKMGGRAAYTLATALFVAAVGCFGIFGVVLQWLPPVAMFPILVFVGLEIMAQSFHATPPKHYAALALALLPTLAALILIEVERALARRPPAEGALVTVQTLRCLAGGFIVTSLLWAAALAALMDGKLWSSAGYLLFAGVCALFGVIHSPLPGSPIAWPWEVYDQMNPREPAILCQSPYHWAAAYGLAAAVLLGLSFFRAEGERLDNSPLPGGARGRG
jgi:AGZA family xanthine/uracil permease-like MFS transporter